MPAKARKRIIESKTEVELHNLLCELFRSMGFKHVVKTHGPLERGVDILFADETPGLGEVWCAAVVKAGQIGGGATRQTDLDVIITQVNEALSNGFPHPVYPSRVVYADRVYVITNGTITGGARKKIQSAAREARYGHIEYWGTERLLEEIDNHRPELYASEYPYLLRYLESAERNFAESKALSVLAAGQQIALSDIAVDPVLLKLDPDRKQFDTLEEFLDYLQKGQKVELRSIHRRLREPKARIVVLGEPGSGKSVLVRSVLDHVAREYASSLNNRPDARRVTAGSGSGAILPIALSTFDLVDESGSPVSVEDAVALQLGKLASGNEDNVQTLIAEGRVRPLLVLDGLDEIPDEATRERVAEAVCEWADRHDTASLLVTSRIEEYCRLNDCLGAGFEVMHLLPLEWKQIKSIIGNLAGVLRVDKTKLLSVVKDELELLMGRLPSTPMVYTLLAVVLSSAEFKEVPATLTLLYERFMELLLGGWDTAKGVAALFDSKQKEALLSELAYGLHERRVAKIRADELQTLTVKYFVEHGMDRGERNANVHRLIQELVGRNSVLSVRSSVYYFRHLSYQEYFAAKHYERMRYSPDNIMDRVLDDWWNNVVFFYCGQIEIMTEPMLDRIQALDASGPNNRVRRALSFGHFAQAAFQSPLSVKRKAITYGLDDIVEFRSWLSSAIDADKTGNLSRLRGSWLLRLTAFLCRQGFGSTVLAAALAAEFDAHNGRNDPESVFRQFLAATALSDIGLHDRLLPVMDKAADPGVKAFLMHRLESLTAGRQTELRLDKHTRHVMAKARRQLRCGFRPRVFDPKRRKRS